MKSHLPEIVPTEKGKVNVRGTVRVHFRDQAPNIGSGYRQVYFIAGRKWVRLTCTSTGARKKMKRSMWNIILKESEQRENRRNNVNIE